MNDLDALYTRLRKYSAKGHRNKEYLTRVRMLPCLICGTTPCDPHHFLGSVGPRKTSDYHTVPLCREHHIEVEANPKKHRYEMFVALVTIMTEYMEGK